MGGGKSSGGGNTTVQMTPEQRQMLQAQTDFLTGTAFPAYQQTISGAKGAYNQTNPVATTAANTAMNVAGQTGATQQAAGTVGTNLGMAGLASLFSPQYKEQQVQAALQAGRESGREAMNQQAASYGAAGGLGSSRAALANQNLASLQEQRQGTVAATTAGQVEANRAAAANQLATLGGQQLAGANQAAAARIGYAQTPQDIYSKYASIVYGVPQGNTTPNFAGTQGQTTSQSQQGKGFKLS